MNVVSIADLILMKQKAGRPKDLSDIKMLEMVQGLLPDGEDSWDLNSISRSHAPAWECIRHRYSRVPTQEHGNHSWGTPLNDVWWSQ